MLQRILLFFIFLNPFFVAQSQKIELDHVTKNELQEGKYPSDSSATAAFLFKKAKTTFKYIEKQGFVSYTDIQIKLKIFKKEGLTWANFKIPFYIGYKSLNDEMVDLISANTYNLENEKIVKTKVTSEGKFKEQINEYWGSKSITFPNVKVGSIIELRYVLKTENLSTLPEFQFQYEIPVKEVEYTTEIPEFYLYKGIQKGNVEVNKEEVIENTSQSFSSQYNQTKSLSYRQIKTTYKVKNVPSIKVEPYVNNIENYYGMLVHELQTIRMPDEPPKQIAKTWDDVAKSIYDEKDFGGELNKNKYFLEAVNVLIGNTTTIEERAKKIFYFVKSRMNWNGKFGYFPKQGVEVAYSDKVGNVAEINLILVAMLRMGGIEADPVLLSTRENGLALFPNRTLLNYVIAAVKLEDSMVLLDATDKYSDFNVLPIRDLNWYGRLIKRDGSSEELDLMPKGSSIEVLNMMASINVRGEVTGKIRDQYFDYKALEFREKYNGVSKESYIENLEKKNNGLQLQDYEVANSNDLLKPIVENYSFTDTNSIEIIGDKMYLYPLLFFTTTENPFKQEDREFPIDFRYPFQKKYNISLSLPDGYSIETLPLSKATAMPENRGTFKYSISGVGNQIQLLFSTEMNQVVFGADYYKVLQNFFKEMINKETERIVLKKN